MTITVTTDTINRQSVSLTTNGPAATRAFGVVTDDEETIGEILQDASIPQLYDAHPYITSGNGYPDIFVTDVSCEPYQGENTLYEVVVSYTTPDAAQKEPGDTEADCIIQVGSSLSASKTSTDKDGNQIFVSLPGRDDQTGEVDYQIPEAIIQFERKESASPWAKNQANAGYVNSSSLGSGNFDERTLLCLGIEGTTIDDGTTWQVVYRFQYKPNTWRAKVLYIDPETDLPAAAVNIGTSTGIAEPDVYPEADFSTLALPFPS